tara:strand:+ start:194 stop:379 length:186 start_codon:yes stop_codon:yes gene_type:complete
MTIVSFQMCLEFDESITNPFIWDTPGYGTGIDLRSVEEREASVGAANHEVWSNILARRAKE